MEIDLVPLREINLTDSFFDTFKESYIGFEDWFNGKRDEKAFVVYGLLWQLRAFLLLKIEDENENYLDIIPTFSKKKRLKICSFKVASKGLGIGKAFIGIVLHMAFISDVDEIYVTIFDDDTYRRELIGFLELNGFKFYGHKNSKSGCEKVYVREVR